jgi:fermentation-respiration switch protein FrsA (DUF1100 family)
VGIKIESPFTAEYEKIMSSVYIPQGIPTQLIVGLRDELIPLTAIRKLIERSPDPGNIQLLKVDDDHDLHKSLHFMIQAIERIRGRFTP